MNKTLILEAFEKAGNDLAKKEGKNNSSDVSKATEISIQIKELSGATLGEKRLRQYHKEAKELRDKQEDISISQKEVIDGLIKYLGYESYNSYSESKASNNGKGIKRDNKKFVLIWIFIAIGLIIAFGVLYFRDNQKWMVWNEDHYEVTKFDAELLKEGTLKLYKEDRIENFKKINCDCGTIYFTTNGDVKIWYGKNKEGKLECFTSFGLHPETGKTLKPITPYMIKKYLCDNYK